MSMRKIPVIIDTDIGDDIDDAFALCLAMKSPEIELLGVTTVFKDTVRRAKIAKRLIRLGGMDKVPVIPGCGIPLCNPVKFGVPQDFGRKPDTYIDDTDEEPLDEDTDAVTFLRDTAAACAEPLTLVTLGPLTNIALFITQHRGLIPKIGRIVMMGGAYFMNYQEHNISCDPEAAQIVLDSGIPVTAVGLDVTFQCKLSGEQIRMLDMDPHPCIRFLMAMRRNWGHDVYLHDPLAVAAAFDPTLTVREKHCFAVELHGMYARGIMVNLSDFNWKKDKKGSMLEVCSQVDSKRFVDMAMERLTAF